MLLLLMILIIVMMVDSLTAVVIIVNVVVMGNAIANVAENIFTVVTICLTATIYENMTMLIIIAIVAIAV